ncbi:MAG: hypothetical protein WCJ03_09665 [Bacteroidales bacterium]
MKTNHWKIFPYLFVLILSSCTSCDEPDPTVLPAEIQSGKNTFGCYINKELFVGGFAGFMSPKPFNAWYSVSSNHVTIIVDGVLNSDFKRGACVVDLSTTFVRTNSALQIENANCYNTNGLYPYYVVKNAGEIYFTKLDTINKIVSGRFKFAAKSADWQQNLVDNDSIVITNGRFDLKLTINN